MSTEAEVLVCAEMMLSVAKCAPMRGTGPLRSVGMRINIDRASLPRKVYAHAPLSIMGEAGAPAMRELNHSEDFKSIANQQDLVSICGFGSLLSERSARYTFPNLLNFRVAMLPGFRRIFAHTAPIFFERGIANLETKEISSLSVEPSAENVVLVTVFEISLAEVPAFIEREYEFRFLVVNPQYAEGGPSKEFAVVCSKYTDEEFFQIRCRGDAQEYDKRYGKYGITKIWQDDILPCRTYLRHCVLAAKNLGAEAYNNFLDHTYLADRKTTIRQHLTADPTIMEEEPPPSLRVRYGG